MSSQFKVHQDKMSICLTQVKEIKIGDMSKETTSNYIRVLSQSVFCRGITTHRHFFRFAIYSTLFTSLRVSFQSIWVRIRVYVDNCQPIYLLNWLFCARYRFYCGMSENTNSVRSLKVAEKNLSIRWLKWTWPEKSSTHLNATYFYMNFVHSESNAEKIMACFN